MTAISFLYYTMVEKRDIMRGVFKIREFTLHNFRTNKCFMQNFTRSCSNLRCGNSLENSTRAVFVLDTDRAEIGTRDLLTQGNIPKLLTLKIIFYLISGPAPPDLEHKRRSQILLGGDRPPLPPKIAAYDLGWSG